MQQAEITPKKRLVEGLEIRGSAPEPRTPQDRLDPLSGLELGFVGGEDDQGIHPHERRKRPGPLLRRERYDDVVALSRRNRPRDFYAAGTATVAP